MKNEEKNFEFESVVINDDGINVKIRKRKGKLAKKISALMPLLSVVAFLVLGFCFNLWHPGWIVFLCIPFVEIIIGLFNKKGKSLWVSLSAVFSVIVYLLLGFILNAWHPGWLVFFIVPIVGILVD